MSSKRSKVTSRTLSSNGRKKSMSKPIIFTKTFPQVKVIFEGQDVTPIPLITLILNEAKDNTMEPSITGGSGSLSTGVSTFKTTSANKLRSEIFKMGNRTTFMKSVLENEDVTIVEASESSYEVGLDIEEPQEATKEMPQHVSLKLTETDTFTLVEFTSSTSEKNTPEGDATEADNELYDFMTIGKGRNRKVVTQEIQTTPTVYKTRDTQPARIRRNNDFVFVSGWDMIDSYENKPEPKKHAPVALSEDDYEGQEEGVELTPEEKEMIRLVKTDKFQNAVIVMQRLLANNNFNEAQKRFRGLSDPDPFREDIEYNYQLKHLWTFENHTTAEYRVVCFQWNPSCRDVLAVGYGKYYFNDPNKGMVMLWNIKNPVQPEREYLFDNGVTSIDFSKNNPNLLAIGFYNGFIKVIDVSSRHIRIICQTTKNTFQCFESVWQINFEKDKHKGTENLITFAQDGRICKIGPIGAPAMITTQIMRVVKGEGKLKGLQTLKKCRAKGVEVCRYPACFNGAFHPVETTIYYVGTNEGVVYKCSKHYFHQHLHAFLAHDGGVNEIKFSPFCGKLLMTCGNDWHIRLWCEDISDPLIELRMDMHAVSAADWSPIHSTILASVSGRDIHIWDLQRKTYTSQFTCRSPTNQKNTNIIFTEDGRCVTVGDVGGSVHIFSLEDMPFSPFFQASYLTHAIKRALVSKPSMLQEVVRVGKLHYVEALILNT